MKNKVIVRIMGHEYTLKSEDTREYMQRVANLVDDRMQELANTHKRLSLSMVAVLTALNFADDFVKLQDFNEDLSARMEDPGLEVQILRDELSALKLSYHEKVAECETLMQEFQKQMRNAMEYEQGIHTLRQKMQEITGVLAENETRLAAQTLVTQDAVQRKMDLENEVERLTKALYEQAEQLEAQSSALETGEQRIQELESDLEELINV